MTAPILAVLNVLTSDYVTRARWNSKYIICFISEDIQVDVSTPSKQRELNFESITEDDSRTLPITLENKNCVDLPILLSILQVTFFLFLKISGKIQLYNQGITTFFLCRMNQRHTAFKNQLMKQ